MAGRANTRATSGLRRQFKALVFGRGFESRRLYSFLFRADLAERSKAPVSGTGLFEGVGSNPTVRIFFFVFASDPPFHSETERGPTSTLVWLERQPTLVVVTIRV